MTLSREECDGISSANSVQALRDLKARRLPLPGLAVLDVTRPAMRASVCIGLLRSHQEWRRTPIIATTDQDDMLTGLKARLAGAHGLLARPFPCQHLMALVRTSVQPWPSPQGESHGEERKDDQFT